MPSFLQMPSKAVLVVVAGIGMASHASAGAPSRLERISVAEAERATEIRLQLSRAVPFSVFRLSRPKRLVVDLTHAQLAGAPAWKAIDDRTAQYISTRVIDRDGQHRLRVTVALKAGTSARVLQDGPSLVLRLVQLRLRRDRTGRRTQQLKQPERVNREERLRWEAARKRLMSEHDQLKRENAATARSARHFKAALDRAKERKRELEEGQRLRSAELAQMRRTLRQVNSGYLSAQARAKGLREAHERVRSELHALKSLLSAREAETSAAQSKVSTERQRLEQQVADLRRQLAVMETSQTALRRRSSAKAYAMQQQVGALRLKLDEQRRRVAVSEQARMRSEEKRRPEEKQRRLEQQRQSMLLARAVEEKRRALATARHALTERRRAETAQKLLAGELDQLRRSVKARSGDRHEQNDRMARQRSRLLAAEATAEKARRAAETARRRAAVSVEALRGELASELGRVRKREAFLFQRLNKAEGAASASAAALEAADAQVQRTKNELKDVAQRLAEARRVHRRERERLAHHLELSKEKVALLRQNLREANQALASRTDGGASHRRLVALLERNLKAQEARVHAERRHLEEMLKERESGSRDRPRYRRSGGREQVLIPVRGGYQIDAGSAQNTVTYEGWSPSGTQRKRTDGTIVKAVRVERTSPDHARVVIELRRSVVPEIELIDASREGRLLRLSYGL